MNTDLQTPVTDLIRKPFEEKANVIQKPDGTIDEEKILNKIKTFEKTWKGKNEKLRDEAKRNEKIYFARYIDSDRFPADTAPIQVPKLFLNLETNIPVVTRKSPEPIVEIYPRNKKNERISKLLLAELKQAWQMSEDDDGLEMQPKQEENMRNLYIQKVMIYKYYYDTVLKRMRVKVVPIDKLIIPFEYDSVYECPAIIELVNDSLGKLKQMFPEKAEALQEEVGYEASDSTTIDYIEYWENNSVSWKFRDILLGSDKNPNWNWKFRDGVTSKRKQDSNHFKRPQKPYIIETDLKRNSGLISTTSLVEISTSSVKALDRRKNEIDKNVRMANGKLIVAGSTMTKESFSQMDLDKVQAIYLDEAETTAGAFDIVTGRTVDSATFTDSADTNAVLDGITGATATLRGERQATETKAGREILRDSSLGRLEPLFRLNERISQKIFNARLQLLAVFGFEDSPVYVDSEDEDNQDIQYLNREIFKGRKILLTVKDGSTVPIDKKSEQAQAWDEVQAGVISVLDYHRIMEKDDPEGLALRAFQQINAPQELYQNMGDEDNYNTEAIKHIMGVVYRTMDFQQLFDSQDVDMFKAHLKTHEDYFKGKDIYDGMIGFKDINDLNVQAELQEHVRIEADLLESMVKQNIAQLQQLQAMGAPIDPAMVDQLLGSQQQPPQQGIQPIAGSETPQNMANPQPDMEMQQINNQLGKVANG